MVDMFSGVINAEAQLYKMTRPQSQEESCCGHKVGNILQTQPCSRASPHGIVRASSCGAPDNSCVM